MPRKLRLPLMMLGMVIVLAVAAFAALSQLNPNLAAFSGLRLPGAATEAGGQKPSVTYEVVRATELPAANPDVVGRLEQRQDNSLMVRPDSKGAPAPLIEVVVTGQTRLYRNATGDFIGTPSVSGSTVPMVLAPYSLEQVAAGDNVIAWGERRGDRLVAKVVMVEK